MLKKPQSVLVGWLSACIFLIIAVVGWRYVLRKESPPILRPSVPLVQTRTTQTNNSEAAAAVYAKQIVPLLDEFDRDNDQAVDRAMQTFHDRMAKHHAGVPVFAKDVVGWGTRFGIVSRSASDLWKKYWKNEKNVDTVRDYVSAKFQSDVMSAQELNDDISATLEQFDQDMAANRRKLYAAMSLPLSQIQYARPIQGAGFDQFCQDLQRRTADLAKSQAKDSIVEDLTELATIKASVDAATTATAAQLSRQVVTAILTTVGSDVAVEGIDAGGATVAGAGIGAGGGTVVEPIGGTIIGAGVGLAVGCIIDWWMSDKFEAKLTTQCNDFLDTVEHDVSSGREPTHRGLRDQLTETVRLVGEDQRTTILLAMKQAK